MPSYVIRPAAYINKDGTIQGTSNSGGTWGTATDANIAAYVGDNSDTTGVRSSGSTARFFQCTLSTPTIPSNEFTARVGSFVRWQGGKAGEYVGAQAYKIINGVPAGVSAVATDGRGTPTTNEVSYQYSGWENYVWTDSNNALGIALFMDGDTTAAIRPIIWDAGATVYTLQKATATPIGATITTSSTPTISVDTTATIDWEASTYSWQKLRLVTVEVRVESGGSGVGTGTLISTATKDQLFTATGTLTVNVTLPDSLANGTYKVYARAIRHRESETSIAADQYGAWSSAATLTMSVTPPAAPSLSLAVDNANARFSLTVTPRYQLITNPSFESGMTDWSTFGTVTADASTFYTGTQSARGTASGTSTGVYRRVSVTAGKTYTLSAYAKITSGTFSHRVLIRFYDAGGATLLDSQTYLTIGTNWTRNTVTGTAPAGATQADIYSITASAGSNWWTDAIMFEQGTGGEYADYALYTDPYYTLERSEDNGVTWTPVRGSTAISCTFGTPEIKYEYEATRGINVQFRARVSAYTNTGVLNTSNPSNIPEGTLGSSTWNLKCPQAPNLNMVDVTVIGKPTETIAEDLGVFRPTGRRYPIVVSSSVTGWDGELAMVTSTANEWTQLRALLEAGAVLLLESPFGWAKYIRFVSGAKSEMLGTATTPRRNVSANYVETSRPADTFISLSGEVAVFIDGGVHDTVVWELTYDGGNAATVSFADSIDGGSAN